MNWDDVRVFLALTRAGTLATAAKSAKMDATTIARRIARLESDLGITLFEHGVAGQTLTDHGRRLVAFAETMEDGAQGVQAQAEPRASFGGTIRVSASEGFGTWFIAHRLDRFAARHPGIAVDLVASTGFLNPSRREADVAIMLARPKGGPLVTSKLTDYQLGVYVARAQVDAAGIDTVDDLLCHRLVGYVPDLIFAPELRYLSDVDGRLEASLRSSSISAQAALIANGAGIGILPCFIGGAIEGLVRVLPHEVAITRSFWLVAHRDTRRLARVEAFVDWLRDEVVEAQPLILGAAADGDKRTKSSNDYA